MSDGKRVVILKSGNRLIIDPTTPAIRSLLAPALSFTETKFNYGYAKRLRGPVETVDWSCYTDDLKGRICTSAGYLDRISKILIAAGYRTALKNLTPHPNPEVFEPYWDRLFGHERISLRHRQDEFLLKLVTCAKKGRHARFDCPPGFGKSFLIGLVATVLPRARIDVVTRRVPVLCDRIYPELQGMLPDVGIVGGGQKKLGSRVMLYTAGSLHHSPGDADILIGDEIQELAADESAAKLGRYNNSVNFGFSATHDMRLDNKDMRVEGMFGPIVFSMPYEEAEAHGLVVPMKVIWRDVKTVTDPCENEDDSVEKKRYGIWRHDYRNEIIAEDARSYGPDVQTLITTETVEHAVNLKRLLPEFALVYSENGLDANDRRRYIQQGFIDDDEPLMSHQRRKQLTAAFESGQLKKAICTTVWNVGVSFNKLAVLIRADAGGSPINDVQIPGRVSRSSDGKEIGVIHDYLDQFNTGFKQKAARRRGTYEAQGWEQTMPANTGYLQEDQ